MKTLAVFDFDHTVINDNSDTAVIELIGKHNVPKTIWELHKKDGWTAFMQGIFQLLHDKNIPESDIKAHIENLAPIDGMPQLITELGNRGDDVIILSDSNSYFIRAWLKKQALSEHIVKVFTNPAKFNDQGLLNISMYHYQESCKLSTKNMCKGQIMENFMKEQAGAGNVYDRVVYTGDGLNDFCPILRLGEKDLACVRKGYKCVDLIKKSETEKDEQKVNAEVFEWSTGWDIWEKIK